MHVAVPFSFRQPSKNIKDATMHNDFGSMLVDMKLFDKFADALPFYKKVFNKLKKSFNPFGVLFATKMTVALPFTLPKIMADDITRKFTMVYTNLNASKKRYYFDEKKMLGQFFFANGVNRLSTSFSILTIGDIMSVGCFSDFNCVKDPQILVDHFVRINKECMDELE